MTDDQQKNEYLGHVIVSLMALAIFLANIPQSGLWFPFMSSHALNGVFYKDMIAEMAFWHPRAFAERYYVQYPSLTVGIYPPFFYIIEGFLFALFGLSMTTAKLTVLVFTLLGANALFRLCRLWFPSWLSMVGSILFLLQPSTLFGQKNVLLALPFVSMSILALYCLYLATDRNARWALFFAPLFAAIAFLTKQSAVFLLPVWFVWIIWKRKWRLFKSIPFIFGIIAGVIILIPWIMVNLTTGSGHLSHLDFGISNIWPNCLYYLGHSSEIISYPLFLLSLLSLVFFVKLRKLDSYKFALLWGCSVILFLLPMKWAEPRYGTALVPPLIILSMHVIWYYRNSGVYLLKRRSMCIGLMIVLICLHLDPRKVWDSPDIRGFDKVAEFVAGDSHCVSVLYDGYFNSNFILHMRMRDKDRRVFVFRASKVIFSTGFLVELRYRDLIKTASELYELLNRYSVKYVIQEEKDSINTPANRRLRKWVQGPKFRLVRQFPIPTRRMEGCGNLLAYEYLDYEEKPIGQVELDMPTMGRKIRVSL